MRLTSVARKEASKARFFVTNLGETIIFDTRLAEFNPEISWPESIVKGPRFRVETLVGWKMTTGYLQHVQAVASPIGRAIELIMSLEF